MKNINLLYQINKNKKSYNNNIYEKESEVKKFQAIVLDI